MALFLPYITNSHIWWNNSTAHFLLETVDPSAVYISLIYLGCMQVLIHRMNAKNKDKAEGTEQLNLQHGLTLFLHSHSVLMLINLILNIIYDVNYKLNGSVLTNTTLLCICSVCSLFLPIKQVMPSKNRVAIFKFIYGLIFLCEHWWLLLKFFESYSNIHDSTMLCLRIANCWLMPLLSLKTMVFTKVRTTYDNLSKLTDELHKIKLKLAKTSPYIWPKRNEKLHLLLLLSLVLMGVERIIKLIFPFYMKQLVDNLSNQDSVTRYDLVVIYIGLSFLQGDNIGTLGLIKNLSHLLWTRIEQYTKCTIDVDLFRHLHLLSLRWHLQRKTGEILSVLDRGANCIDGFLMDVLFTFVPDILDFVLAIFYFITTFNNWFGLLMLLTMGSYVAASVWIPKYREKILRKVNNSRDEQYSRSVDSLLNFETVKYYGNEQYELENYENAVKTQHNDQMKQEWIYCFTSIIQTVMLCIGFLFSSILCTHLVKHRKELTVGDFMLFLTYTLDLYSSLSHFGYIFRSLQRNFINMEKLFELLDEKVEITDAPNALPLTIKTGAIEFRNVTFGYLPSKTILHNISFHVPGGKTVAIVGPSGAGKSTIMRLLFRFYDVQKGDIRIDGQNIQLVQQQSLRKCIGVVPQDTVLFNHSIYYNIEYGKLGASKEQIYEAARLAGIHERILSFAQGYETEVGERGLRLSGGEKQRVAIARTLLKAPKIVLLDEATSALDTHTERAIQAALRRVCANRTTIIVAHRLSTIIHADEILVLQNGEIVERGRHDELLLRENGTYASMWLQQFQNLNSDDEVALQQTPNDSMNVESSELKTIEAVDSQQSLNAATKKIN